LILGESTISLGNFRTNPAESATQAQPKSRRLRIETDRNLAETTLGNGCRSPNPREEHAYPLQHTVIHGGFIFQWVRDGFLDEDIFFGQHIEMAIGAMWCDQETADNGKQTWDVAMMHGTRLPP
jgi:hypothetical protein